MNFQFLQPQGLLPQGSMPVLGAPPGALMPGQQLPARGLLGAPGQGPRGIGPRGAMPRGVGPLGGGLHHMQGLPGMPGAMQGVGMVRPSSPMMAMPMMTAGGALGMAGLGGLDTQSQDIIEDTKDDDSASPATSMPSMMASSGAPMGMVPAPLMASHFARMPGMTMGQPGMTMGQPGMPMGQPMMGQMGVGALTAGQMGVGALTAGQLGAPMLMPQLGQATIGGGFGQAGMGLVTQAGMGQMGMATMGGQPFSTGQPVLGAAGGLPIQPGLPGQASLAGGVPHPMAASMGMAMSSMAQAGLGLQYPGIYTAEGDSDDRLSYMDPTQQVAPRERDPDEPDAPDDRTVLDFFNSDLNLKISRDGYSAEALTNPNGFCFCWAGARATYGVNKGRVCYEVTITENLAVDFGEDHSEKDPHILRVGWSMDETSFQLGEESDSYGYGGTGRFSTSSRFQIYGQSFGQGDVIMAMLDLDSSPATISYSVNGEWCGIAHSIRGYQKGSIKDAMYPHVLSKNTGFEINFGQKDPQYPPPPGFRFIDQLPVLERVRGTMCPAKKEDCEMIMVVGLPGAGKTTWGLKQLKDQPEKRYNIIGTDTLIDKMKVNGLPRKNNYHGRWDVLISKATNCLNKMFQIASKRRRNYILDQTNVYPSARKRKLKNFVGFHRVCAVLQPDDSELKRREWKRTHDDGKFVPEEAVLEMKMNYSLPESGDQFVDEIRWLELERGDAQKLVELYNDEGKRIGGGAQKRPFDNQAPKYGQSNQRGFQAGYGGSGPKQMKTESRGSALDFIKQEYDEPTEAKGDYGGAGAWGVKQEMGYGGGQSGQRGREGYGSPGRGGDRRDDRGSDRYNRRDERPRDTERWGSRAGGSWPPRDGEKERGRDGDRGRGDRDRGAHRYGRSDRGRDGDRDRDSLGNKSGERDRDRERDRSSYGDRDYSGSRDRYGSGDDRRETTAPTYEYSQASSQQSAGRDYPNSSREFSAPANTRDFTSPTSQDSAYYSQPGGQGQVDPDILKLSQSLLGPAVVKPEPGATQDTDIRQMTMNQSLGQPWASLMGAPPPLPGLVGIRPPVVDLSRVVAGAGDALMDPFGVFSQNAKGSIAGISPFGQVLGQNRYGGNQWSGNGTDAQKRKDDRPRKSRWGPTDSEDNPKSSGQQDGLLGSPPHNSSFAAAQARAKATAASLMNQNAKSEAGGMPPALQGGMPGAAGLAALSGIPSLGLLGAPPAPGALAGGLGGAVVPGLMGRDASDSMVSQFGDSDIRPGHGGPAALAAMMAQTTAAGNNRPGLLGARPDVPSSPSSGSQPSGELSSSTPGAGSPAGPGGFGGAQARGGGMGGRGGMRGPRPNLGRGGYGGGPRPMGGPMGVGQLAGVPGGANPMGAGPLGGGQMGVGQMGGGQMGGPRGMGPMGHLGGGPMGGGPLGAMGGPMGVGHMGAGPMGGGMHGHMRGMPGMGMPRGGGRGGPPRWQRPPMGGSF